MDERQKREPLHKQVYALLWRERRTCFWSAIAGVLLGIAATIWLRHKLLVIAIALLASLGHGCQAVLGDLKDLH